MSCARSKACHPLVGPVRPPTSPPCTYAAPRVARSDHPDRSVTILFCRYPHGKLIEINSHSLFSKWFSESGKLVQRLFSTVTEMVEDESGFVVVLIGTSPSRLDKGQLVRPSVCRPCHADASPSLRSRPLADEVESLTAARAGAGSGTEPSDAMRVSP